MTGRRDAGHKQFAAIPSATGGIARLAYARAKEAGIALPQLLADSGLTVAQIEDRHARLKVKAQITFLGLVADALGDDLLGFHLAHSFDLREIGLLYYVMASSEVLEDALRRVERYSGIVTEGISLQVHTGKHVTIRFNYVGVERHSDRPEDSGFGALPHSRDADRNGPPGSPPGAGFTYRHSKHEVVP